MKTYTLTNTKTGSIQSFDNLKALLDYLKICKEAHRFVLRYGGAVVYITHSPSPAEIDAPSLKISSRNP